MQLNIQNLSKTYPNGVQALKNLSITINEGMFGLLGPNGAGKSSLMRTIATLQGADSGTITFDGIDVFKDKDELRKKLGYLPQDFGVYQRINAVEMLDHIARLKGMHNATQRKEMVNYLLNKVNLYNVRNKNLGTYSGGMKQRFGIAQALVGDPKLIIVDEPTAGLDPAERNRFYNLLSEIGQDNVVILSTHIVEDIRTLCNEFAIICNGELIMHGTPDAALQELRGKVYYKLVEREEAEALKEKYNVVSTQLRGGKTQLRILSDSHPGNGFEPVEPNLDDVYFSKIAAQLDPVTL